MRYLILIYTNPASRAAWESFSESDRAAGFQEYERVTAELAASGELIVTEALADPSQGRGVSVRDGRTITSDGPFAEAKEQLAGFLLLECESLERAVEVAARLPDAGINDLEVRPVMDYSGLEM